MPKDQGPTERQKRLAEALRRNLKRRKAQGRERAAARKSPGQGAAHGSGSDKDG